MPSPWTVLQLWRGPGCQQLPSRHTGTRRNEVRLDLGLYGTEGLAPLAEGITVTAHRDSIGTLTDSASWMLLRQVWQRGEPPSPSLAAVTTRSLPALRAFLDGERHIEKDEWHSAALAFRSAIAADSSFWLAYHRYVSAQAWDNPDQDEIEPAIVSKRDLNRKLLPDRERLVAGLWPRIPCLGKRSCLRK